MALGSKEWILHFEKDVRILECKSLESQVLEAGGSKTYVFETPSLLKGEEVGTANVFLYSQEVYIEWVKGNKVIKSVTVPGSATIFYEDDKLKIVVRRTD